MCVWLWLFVEMNPTRPYYLHICILVLGLCTPSLPYSQSKLSTGTLPAFVVCLQCTVYQRVKGAFSCKKTNKPKTIKKKTPPLLLVTSVEKNSISLTRFTAFKDTIEFCPSALCAHRHAMLQAERSSRSDETILVLLRLLMLK